MDNKETKTSKSIKFELRILCSKVNTVYPCSLKPTEPGPSLFCFCHGEQQLSLTYFHHHSHLLKKNQLTRNSNLYCLGKIIGRRKQNTMILKRKFTFQVITIFLIPAFSKHCRLGFLKYLFISTLAPTF